jgi:hypothetical protein
MLGAMRLTPEAARVLGSLAEKELTTPQQYPLTLPSLVAACNQASNREPVVDYDEQAVMGALDDLKSQRLVRYVLPSSGRTAVRYRQVLDETLALDRRQRALVAVLLLRGPQTVGELRLRTDRMTEFGGLHEVEHELELLASLDEPLALSLGRRPGQKEERWACPLLETGTGTETGTGPGVERTDEGHGDGPPAGSEGPLDRLQSELADLRTEVGELRRDLDALRTSLGE